jgi:hypothetical protein
MGLKEIYERKKEKILNDKSICKANRNLFKKFFDEEEYKLKRKNEIKELDEASYKTLCCYPPYFRNVNSWFKNKDWKKLTETDIKKVYDDLEDEKLKGMSGKIITCKTDYYEKVFKSLPFEIAGKVDIAKKVMKYYDGRKKEEVRYFDEKTFEKIKGATKTITQRLLCQIAWDIGENIFTLLQLQKKEFVQQINTDNNEIEYIVNLPKEKIKRSRRARSEITNFEETAQLLDIILKDLEDDEYLFHFGHRQALKFLSQAVKKVGAKCIPKGQKVTWKDFRSSMACHLLKIGWTTDEIKARLGHAPSSRILDKYVNYLAIGRHKSKQKTDTGKITRFKNELEDAKQREKLQTKRIERQKEDLKFQETKILDLEKSISEIKKADSIAINLFKDKNVKEALLKAMLKQGTGKDLMEIYSK